MATEKVCKLLVSERHHFNLPESQLRILILLWSGWDHAPVSNIRKNASASHKSRTKEVQGLFPCKAKVHTAEIVRACLREGCCP